MFKVLLVEDNADVAFMMMTLIKHCGHEATWASAGPEAIELARKNPPHLALIDIGLPGMNGFELAEILRNDAQFEQMYLVALSGYGEPSDLARAKGVGFGQHLLKPVSLEVLMKVIQERERLLSQAGS